MTDQKILDLREQANNIKDMYATKAAMGNFSALLMAPRGHGKTTTLGTCPGPVLVDMFDPRGSVVLEKLYPDLIKSGMLLIRPWWGDSAKRPTKYAEWDRQFQADLRSGFFNNFGTYGFDSYTTFQQILANYLGNKGQSAKLDTGALAMSAYQPLYATMYDIVNLISAQDCNFIMTAHLVAEQDGLTGEISMDIDAFKGMRSKLPSMFSEKYAMMIKKGTSDNEHFIVTKNYKKYTASTQLGAGGTFDTLEEPNFRKLLKKAGFPYEDKPSLFGG